MHIAVPAIRCPSNRFWRIHPLLVHICLHAPYISEMTPGKVLQLVDSSYCVSTLMVSCLTHPSGSMGRRWRGEVGVVEYDFYNSSL